MQSHQDLMGAAKCKQPACKVLRVWTKNNENFENFQENFEIFWSKSLLNIDFFHNSLLNISWISDSAPKSLYLWKITANFSNNFSDFGVGERSGVPPLPTLLFSYLIHSKVTDLSLVENASRMHINYGFHSQFPDYISI